MVIDEELESEESQEADDLFEHYKFSVDAGQARLRLDKFLTLRLPKTSRNKIQQAAINGCVLVDGKAQKSNYKVRPGDEVTLVMAYPKRELEVIAEDIPLDIVYEDDELLIVHKGSNMVVHPGHGNYTGTLINGLLHHIQQKDPDGSPALVHRIDKDTTGLLLVGKTEEAQAFLARQFFERSIHRRYVALVWGDLQDDKGTIEGHLARDPRNRKLMRVFPDGEKGKMAITHYEVLKRFGYVTLVSCKLETGRTHQIRIHFKYIGHPLFGDKTYGGDRIMKGTTFTKYKQFVENCFSILPRQALHAQSLGFEHPKKGEMNFESDLPADMQQVIDKWERYTESGHPLQE